MAATYIYRKDRKRYIVSIHHQGKRQSESYKTKREAKAACNRYNRQLESGAFTIKKDEPTKKETLNFFINQWFETVVLDKDNGLAKSTYERYSAIWKNKIKDDIGRQDIKHITKIFLLSHFRDLKTKGHSKSDIALRLCVISGGLSMAEETGKVSGQESQGIIKKLCPQKGKNKAKKKEIVTFTKEETNTILNITYEHYRRDYLMVLLLFTTGLRLGEALGLNWDCVNFHTGFILVKRSYRGTDLSESTKTGKERMIPIDGELLELLNQRRKQKNLGRFLGKDNDAVFTRNGIRLSQNSFRRDWGRILERSGLEYRKTHTIRHTTATRLMSQGFPPKLIAEILGHTVQTLLSTYTHESNDDEQEKREMLRCFQNAAERGRKQQRAANSNVYSPSQVLVPKRRLELPRPYGH